MLLLRLEISKRYWKTRLWLDLRKVKSHYWKLLDEVIVKNYLFRRKVGARFMSTSDYKATRDDEHSFVTGAVVKLVKKHIDGWWVVK